MTWATAGMWAALAGAVITGFPPSSDLAVIICLVALAVIFVALPFLPTDLEGERATRIGRVHLLAAIAWFALSYACMGNVIRLLQPLVPAALHATLVVMSWVALIGLIALVVALVLRPLRRIAFGISERVFLVAVNLFYLTTAIGILIM